MIDVSIIIVNFKVKKEIINCINSIEKNVNKITYEIIVVDNEGDSSLNPELKKHKQARYILSKKNLGFSAGNNLGASHAKGEYLFFLNPDTLVKGDAIDKLYEFIKSKKNIGIVSPLLVDNHLKSFDTQSRKELTPLNAIYSFSFLRKFFSNKSIYNDPFFKNWNKTTPIETDTVPGAALMISRNLFDNTKGFDERFFLYFEENDLSKRIKKLGYKLFIYPGSKIIHKVGQSTRQIKEKKDIFEKSRFLYFRKHYGLVKALPLESFLRLNKNSLIIFIILLIAIFLRIVNLSISMPFIGDQGWFYLSARDLLMEGKIPLVGITSSHTWLHQGPLWTYMLSVVLFLGNFNPLSGGFLTAVFGAGSVFLMYKLGSEMFSRKIGIISSLLYSVSPLIVFFERMPFDPAPIPFFTILYFYSIYKWITGKIYYFPFVLFLIGVLYNLELATFTLFIPLFVLLLFGVVKRKHFFVSLLNKRILTKSFIALLVPMIPVIIYDLSHGFKQTLVFFLWVVYKPFSFLFRTENSSIINTSSRVFEFLSQNLQKLIFDNSLAISSFIFLLSLGLLIFLVYKEKKYLQSSRFLLLCFLVVAILGILINQTPSDAYLPIIFPFVIFTVSILFEYLYKIRIFKFSVVFILLLMIINNFSSSYINTFKPDYVNRVKAAEEIIVLSKNQEYNLIGRGNGSQFISFTMNYEYLLWWKNHPPSEKVQKLKIYVSEDKFGIHVK